ncbi:MAG: hypothetical protein IKT40_04595 [Bacilli bacterium]|nr:hypothetical protein [Bacilli bacterium]
MNEEINLSYASNDSWYSSIVSTIDWSKNYGYTSGVSVETTLKNEINELKEENKKLKDLVMNLYTLVMTKIGNDQLEK